MKRVKIRSGFSVRCNINTFAIRMWSSNGMCRLLKNRQWNWAGIWRLPCNGLASNWNIDPSTLAYSYLVKNVNKIIKMTMKYRTILIRFSFWPPHWSNWVVWSIFETRKSYWILCESRWTAREVTCIVFEEIMSNSTYNILLYAFSMFRSRSRRSSGECKNFVTLIALT